MSQPSWLQRIWASWRREIIRGAVLFAIVVAGGVFVLNRVRAFEPLAMLREMNLEDHGGDRTWTPSFQWSGHIEAGEQVWIRNLNGSITVERAAGESVYVVAEKSWRHGDPESVEVVARPSGGSVTICAVWNGRDASCGPDGDYRVRGGKGHNDVAVRFFVHLPAGVELDASTVNGAIAASHVESPLELETVNGAVVVQSVTGELRAQTVNGSITAALDKLRADDDVELQTVNGSIRAQLPDDANADLEASTVNGKVHTDLPLRVVGRVNPRKLSGTIGNGGTTLKLTTVNGSVTLDRLDAAAPPAVAAPPHAPVPPVPGEAPHAPARVRVEVKVP